MAVIPLDTDGLRRRTLAARVDRYVAERGLGFNPYLGRTALMTELARLDAMSDADLAGLGLTRASILPHVIDRAFGG